MKVCTKCQTVKEESEFYVVKKSGLLRSRCKACEISGRRKYELVDPNHREKSRTAILKWKAANPGWQLLHKYGLTLEKREAIFRRQGGVCAVCKKNKKLVVDHNHSTGRVRGLLCNGCNVALGQIGDCAETARALARYLDEQNSEL